MALSKSNPKYQALDPNKTVFIPPSQRFVVYDQRSGIKNYNKARKVKYLGLDSNGDLTHYAFESASADFESIKNYKTTLAL